MGRIRIEHIKMPAFWASYLINGDASGITNEEREAIDAHLATQGIASVLSCADESHFTWSFGDLGGDAEGGEVLLYDVVMATPAKKAAAFMAMQADVRDFVEGLRKEDDDEDEDDDADADDATIAPAVSE